MMDYSEKFTGRSNPNPSDEEISETFIANTYNFETCFPTKKRNGLFLNPPMFNPKVE
jgi:hypothetical protein